MEKQQPKATIVSANSDSVLVRIPRDMVRFPESGGQLRIDLPAQTFLKEPSVERIREAARTSVLSETWEKCAPIPARLRRVAQLLGDQCPSKEGAKTYLDVLNHLRDTEPGRFSGIVFTRNLTANTFLRFFRFLIGKGLLEVSEAQEILTRSDLNPILSGNLAKRIGLE